VQLVETLFQPRGLRELRLRHHFPSQFSSCSSFPWLEAPTGALKSTINRKNVPVEPSGLIRMCGLLGTSRFSLVSKCVTALISRRHCGTSESYRIAVSGGKETTMGIDVGAKSSSMAAMNVVPLIDILLVLIIIFMVITPLTPKGLDAAIPQSAKKDTPSPGPMIKTIVVQVFDTGKLKINEEDATWDSLGVRLSDVFKERAEKVAFVQSEDVVKFFDVARAIDIMRSSGIEKVGLMTTRLEAGQ